MDKIHEFSRMLSDFLNEMYHNKVFNKPTDSIGKSHQTEAELYDRLLTNYNKFVRPVRDPRKSVEVQVKLTLSQVIDVVRVYKIFTNY